MKVIPVFFVYNMMSEERKAQVRSNREKLRLKLKGAMDQSILSSSSLLQRQEKGSEEPGSLFMPAPKEKRRLQRKKSLNIGIIPRSFDMFECGEIEINSDFEVFYEILNKIDEGTQSVVYECRQRDTAKLFAVKVIKNKDHDLIHTLKKQFIILRSLNHENILCAYKLFVNEKRGVSHLVTELCPYENLKIYIAKHRVLKQPKVACIISTLLGIVQYLHRKSVCHRDIKPENILYNPEDSHLKLIDFQISKMIKYDYQRLQMWTRTGTLYYKAPEMFTGGYNQKIDIWAIGVVCYEMLTGRLPFQSRFEKDTIRKIINDEPNMQRINATDSCLNFLCKCLAKDPNQRFSASEALQSPFLLKCSSTLSTGTSARKKNASFYVQKPIFQREEHTKYHEEVSDLLNTESLTPDIGIRLVVDFDSEDEKNQKGKCSSS